VNEINFPGRVGVVQRVIPAYRAPFFAALGEACLGGLCLFAGQPASGEAIQTTDRLEVAHYVPAGNLHIGRPGSPLYLCWQRGLLDWLEKWQPESLIVEANPRYLSTRLAIRWMHARHRPVLGWGLGAPPSRGILKTLRNPGRQRFLASFDGLIAYSQRGADEYRQLGFPPHRVFTAPNAAAPRPTSPPPQRHPAFAGRPEVLFVGRLQKRKRIDDLLVACSALPPEIQPEVWVVGDGPASADIRALAEAVYPRARFPGARRGAELEPFYSSSDLFVLPGTGGLAVQEAMAHGLPVIVGEGDGTQDDLVSRENGWRVVSGDVDSLTAVLLEALSDPAQLRRMGRESYRIVSEEINLERMVEVFLQALVSVRVAGS